MLIQLGLRCHEQDQRICQAGVALREQPIQRPANRARQGKARQAVAVKRFDIKKSSAVPSE
jgi:hypothetical protein